MPRLAFLAAGGIFLHSDRPPNQFRQDASEAIAGGDDLNLIA